MAGSGVWVKSFLKIARRNRWILLSATPGDNWSDYIPLFIANGFYKNRTQFTREHIVYSHAAKFPKIERYLDEGRLERLRDSILIDMDFKRPTQAHHEDVYVQYDISLYKDLMRSRWDIWKNEPIENAGGLCYCLRRAVNQDESRQRMALEIAEKHDSQDICFVPQGKYADIINKVKPNAALAGDIVHMDGRVLGRHDGIVHYTIGQRKGLGVATGEPLYVVYLDARTRRVIVGPREALDTHRVYLRDVNWLGDALLEDEAKDGFACFSKVRSTRPPAPAIVHCDERGVYVDLAIGEAGVAPGQACVLYSAPGANARVFGGGFIERSERAEAAEASLKQLLAQPAAA